MTDCDAAKSYHRQISGHRQISRRCEACPPARLGNRASLGASSRSPARPRRPRSGLRSGGADPVSVRLSRRSRTSQPGPAGFAASSDRAALILFRLGPAAAHGHRSQVPQASQRPLIGRSDEQSPAPPQPTNSGIREVPTQFVWCRAQWRRQLNPAQKRIRTGPLLLALTRRRVSSLLGRRTCRSTPRRRWGGSNQAGWPGADST